LVIAAGVAVVPIAAVILAVGCGRRRWRRRRLRMVFRVDRGRIAARTQDDRAIFDVRSVGGRCRAMRDQQPFDLGATQHRRTGCQHRILQREAGFAGSRSHAALRISRSRNIHFDVEQAAVCPERRRAGDARNCL
jgi:hypothetical protein